MKATDFLAIAKEFHLGSLPTESPHPNTKSLSNLAQDDCLKAVALLHQVDLNMLEVLKTKISEIKKLSIEIKDVFNCGGQVFLCGCGATGRLSLALETIWRHDHPGDERVQSFMAGGFRDDIPALGGHNALSNGSSEQIGTRRIQIF